MSKHKTRCQCCLDPTPDMTRRFHPRMGFICPDCFEFSAYAAKKLRRVGIEHCDSTPVRYAATPTPETP